MPIPILELLVQFIVMIAMLDGNFDRDSDRSILNIIPNICVWEDSTYSEGEC